MKKVTPETKHSAGGQSTAALPAPSAPQPQQDGVLVLNKPGGPTSSACLGLLKRRLGQKKIGHAGTLDPMASGVLLVLLGQATKISGYLLEAGEKVYSATVQFGVSTDTWDAQGAIVEQLAPDAPLPENLREETLRATLRGWLGKSEQQVPPYSAAKHHGRPLYELARKGIETPVKIKTIEISRAELEWFRPPLVRFRVACSSGTYIRSLAHSLGTRFGCGAMLVELTREYSHPFSLEEAVSLDDLLASPDLLPGRVRGVTEALPHLPALPLSASQSGRVKNGHALPVGELTLVTSGQAILLDENGLPLALAQRKNLNGDEVWAIGRGLWNQ